MTTGKGYAPLGKSKVISTPDVNRNNKPVKTSGDKKDRNAVTGKQKKPYKVTWF